MANNLELIRNSINGATIRATAEAILQTVAVTDDEFITARGGFLGGRWGAKVERYQLSELVDLRTINNPGSNILQLELGGPRPRSITVMYREQASTDFDKIVALLRRRLPRRAEAV